jgi:hypothetical protein
MTQTQSNEFHDEANQQSNPGFVPKENVTLLIAITLLIGFFIGVLMHDSIMNFNPHHAVWKNSLMESK